MTVKMESEDKPMRVLTKEEYDKVVEEVKQFKLREERHLQEWRDKNL